MFRYTVEKRVVGWTCHAHFKAFTASQFTAVEFVTPTYHGKWAWLAFLKCWWSADRVKYEIEWEHKAKRDAVGWA